MIDQAYLQTVRDDLLARVKEGDILLNDTVSVPVQAESVATVPTADIRNGIVLQVSTKQIPSIPVITNAKLRTRTGAVVAEKKVFLEMNGSQYLSLMFAVEIKGGQ